MKDFDEKIFQMNSVSPTFFIGLGGSGSDIVDRVAGKIQRRWNWEMFDGLVHFFALDTNTHDLANLQHVPTDNRILISDFGKQDYVRRKRGEAHMDEDTFLTQWVHDWYNFRGTRGAGAGQIRIESRLCLYYQLEQDRGTIVQRLNRAIDTSKHHDNPFRKNNPPRFNIFIYGSVAGGTGSGGFLTIASLLRELILAQGWNPTIIGTLLLPSLFLNDVPGALQTDINANGYAALKELEHLMKLGYEASAAPVTFHYNPNNQRAAQTAQPPFTFVYVADKPAGYEVSDYKNAIADSAYVQLFSPIIGHQDADYDNYEKRQKQLAHGYATRYGSYGCAVLLLPDADLLNYCALRYCAEAMSRYLMFRGADDGDGPSVPYDDPRFRRMDEAAQAEAIDQGFARFVRRLAAREERDEVAGPYSAVVALKTRAGTSLVEAFERAREAIRNKAEGAAPLRALATFDITEQNIKVDAEVSDLRNAVGEGRKAISAWLEALEQEIEAGAWLADFFARAGVNPMAQRYFLIHLKTEKLRADLSDLEGKLRQTTQAVDLNSEAVGAELRRHTQQLTQTAEYTLLERIKGRNEDFEVARRAFLDYFNATLVDGNRRVLVLEAERRFLDALLQASEAMLASYRSVSLKASEAVEAVHREAARLMETGVWRDQASQSNAYALDVEALRSMQGERCWDRFFEDRFLSGGRDLDLFDEAAVLRLTTEAFSPATDSAGRTVARDSDAIIATIREALIEQGREQLKEAIVGRREGGTNRNDKGLLLDEALRCEARYHYADAFEADSSGREPTEEEIARYIRDKLRFCMNKSAIMANIDEMQLADQAATMSRIDLVGLHDFYVQELGPLLDQVAPQINRLPTWRDEKRVVFYQARLGVPLYIYRRINTEMKADYRELEQLPDKKRGYPLHIDSNWEHGLLDLDPNDRRRQEQQRARRARLVDFALASIVECVAQDEGRIVWKLDDGHSGVLGEHMADAFAAFFALDDRVLRHLLEPTRELRERLQRSDPDARERLDGWLETLDKRLLRLKLSQDARHHRSLSFLTELEQALITWRDELPG